MAFGTKHVIVGEVPNFIPELWSDEVIAAYKANLVMASNVRKLNHRGKKGDIIKVPTPTRGSATSKSADTIVTFLAHGTDTGLSISIDKHYEYSRLIEDMADVQALESLRRVYTDDGGYAIAKQVDQELHVEGFRADGTITTVTSNIIQDDYNLTGTAYEGDGSSWAQAATSTDVTDAGLRILVKALDDADAPMAGRVLVVPTIMKSDLMGLSRFTEQAFVGEVGGGNTIRNGLVGDVYGMEVFVSTNLPQIDSSGGTNQLDTFQCFQKDALVLVEQLGVRSQSQYKQEYLADLLTVDMIWGQKIVRASSFLNGVVPSS
jgi:hypothetical protein